MATSDIIGGGNIEPRGLEEEMRSVVPRLRDVASSSGARCPTSATA